MPSAGIGSQVIGLGGGARVPTLISDTDFIDIAALEAFASANANLLLNNAGAFSTAFIVGDLYNYQGTEGVYVVGQWVDATPEGLTPEAMAFIASGIALPEGAVPQGGGGVLSESGAVADETTIATQKSFQSGLNSYRLGAAWSVTSSGRSLGATLLPDELYNRVLTYGFDTTENPVTIKERPSIEEVAQPIDSDLLTNPNWSRVITPFGTPPEDGQAVFWVEVKVDPTSVLTNFNLRIKLNGTLFASFDYETVTSGVFRLIYKSPIDVVVGDNFDVSITSPDGDVKLLGDSVSGEPYQLARVAVWDYREVGLTKSGIADYNNGVGFAFLSPNTWVTLLNDGSGPFTNTDYIVDGATSLLNTVSGRLDFSQLTLGDIVIIRPDFTILPFSNNQRLRFRYLIGQNGQQYSLEKRLSKMNDGAGSEYKNYFSDMIYIGDDNTRLGGAFVQVKTSGNGLVQNLGVAISVIKRGY